MNKQSDSLERLKTASDERITAGGYMRRGLLITGILLVLVSMVIGQISQKVPCETKQVETGLTYRAEQKNDDFPWSRMRDVTGTIGFLMTVLLLLVDRQKTVGKQEEKISQYGRAIDSLKSSNQNMASQLSELRESFVRLNTMIHMFLSSRNINMSGLDQTEKESEG